LCQDSSSPFWLELFFTRLPASSCLHLNLPHPDSHAFSGLFVPALSFSQSCLLFYCCHCALPCATSCHRALSELTPSWPRLCFMLCLRQGPLRVNSQVSQRNLLSMAICASGYFGWSSPSRSPSHFFGLLARQPPFDRTQRTESGGSHGQHRQAHAFAPGSVQVDQVKDEGLRAHSEETGAKGCACPSLPRQQTTRPSANPENFSI